MQRLVLAVLFLALLGVLAYMLLRGATGLWRAVERVESSHMTANETLNKLSFALLVALILYVSVWGG